MNNRDPFSPERNSHILTPEELAKHVLRNAVVLAGCERAFRERRGQVAKSAGAANCQGCWLLDVNRDQFMGLRDEVALTPENIQERGAELKGRLDQVEDGECPGKTVDLENLVDANGTVVGQARVIHCGLDSRSTKKSPEIDF